MPPMGMSVPTPSGTKANWITAINNYEQILLKNESILLKIPGPRTKAVEPARLKSEMAVVLSLTVVAEMRCN